MYVILYTSTYVVTYSYRPAYCMCGYIEPFRDIMEPQIFPVGPNLFHDG